MLVAASLWWTSWEGVLAPSRAPPLQPQRSSNWHSRAVARCLPRITGKKLSSWCRTHVVRSVFIIELMPFSSISRAVVMQQQQQQHQQHKPHQFLLNPQGQHLLPPCPLSVFYHWPMPCSSALPRVFCAHVAVKTVPISASEESGSSVADVADVVFLHKVKRCHDHYCCYYLHY
jgi:hypothetical protein